jgi:hypothetical protein
MQFVQCKFEGYNEDGRFFAFKRRGLRGLVLIDAAVEEPKPFHGYVTFGDRADELERFALRKHAELSADFTRGEQ